MQKSSTVYLSQQQRPGVGAGSPAKKSRRRRRAATGTQYQLAPATIGVTSTATKPSVRSQPNGTTVRHRELITAVSGSTGFQVQFALPCNPGLSGSYPWLSTIAGAYDLYKIVSQRYVFEPFSGTSTQGNVIMSFSYDAADNEPENMTTASSMAGAITSPVWQTATMQLDPRHLHPIGPYKYTRSRLFAGDVKTYDAGILFVSTNSCANTNPIGNLFVEYSIDLCVPQVASVSSSESCSSLMALPNANQTLSTGVAQAIAFAPMTIDGLNWQLSGGNLIVAATGRYRLMASCVVSDTAAENLALVLAIRKTSLAGSTIVSSGFNDSAPSTTNAWVQVVAHGIADLTAGDVVVVGITATAAAGTITMLKDATVLTVELA